MQVSKVKKFSVGGSTYVVSFYNMPFQGHQRNDFDVANWADGWQPVTSGKAGTFAAAVAQAKAFLVAAK